MEEQSPHPEAEVEIPDLSEDQSQGQVSEESPTKRSLAISEQGSGQSLGLCSLQNSTGVRLRPGLPAASNSLGYNRQGFPSPHAQSQPWVGSGCSLHRCNLPVNLSLPPPCPPGPLEHRHFPGASDSEDSQASLEAASVSRSDVQKLWTAAGLTQRGKESRPTRERDSSVDSTSSRVAVFNWLYRANSVDSESFELTRASISASAEERQPPSTLPLPLRRITLGANLEPTDASNIRHALPEPSQSDSNPEIQETSHRAYWAEQQNRLPLPLSILMEQETLEILTRSLNSYCKGIGHDHKLTQQLRRHVEQLRRNLKRRTLDT